MANGKLDDCIVSAEVQRIRASRKYEADDIEAAKREHLLAAIARVGQDGVWAEFGVSRGTTITAIARATEATVYGFDWFQGLPEEWGVGGDVGSFTEGAFAGRPSRLPSNVRLVEGLFVNSVVPFFRRCTMPIAFAHIDCDLYSSTAVVLSAIAPKFLPGTVLVFDELYNYPRQGEHEMRALIESAKLYEFQYAYIGHVPARAQASLIVTANASSSG